MLSTAATDGSGRLEGEPEKPNPTKQSTKREELTNREKRQYLIFTRL